MKSEKYNGFANRETWLVNLWLGDFLHNVVSEEDGQVSDDYIKNIVEDIVWSNVSSTSSLCADFVGGCLSSVDWTEISKHAHEE